jgi:hypothetical protein
LALSRGQIRNTLNWADANLNRIKEHDISPATKLKPAAIGDSISVGWF